jgi:CHRD domain
MRGRQRLAIIALLLLVAAVAVAVAGTAGAVQAQGRPLSTTLTGAAEIPGPGDPDGSGTATLTVNPGLGQICYELTVSGIAPATAAHIHVGAAGVAGPVVVPLAPPTDGTSSGCAEVSRELALAILKSPSDYYVNVHNAEFPAGAVRGQLSK